MTGEIKLKHNQAAKIAPKNNPAAFQGTSEGTACISALIQRPHCIRCLFPKPLDQIHYDFLQQSSWVFSLGSESHNFIYLHKQHIHQHAYQAQTQFWDFSSSSVLLSFWVWGKRNLGNYSRYGKLKGAPQMMSSGAQGIWRNNTGKSMRSQSCHAAQVRLAGIPV